MQKSTFFLSTQCLVSQQRELFEEEARMIERVSHAMDELGLLDDFDSDAISTDDEV